MKNALGTVAGVVVGYLVMAILITLVQEVWLGGVSWGTSSLLVLTTAGLFTCLSGAVGGTVAIILGRRTGRLAAIIMACLVGIETTVLLLTGKLAGPLWFDLLAAGSLAVAVLIGGELWLRWRGGPATSAS